MLSMTGYGRGEYSENGINVLVEVKSVNNRNFDFNAKIPRSFICFEDKIRKIVNSYIKRGRIDLFLNFSDDRKDSLSVELNLKKAKEYVDAAKKISETFNVCNDCSSAFILKCPDVIKDDFNPDVSEYEGAITCAVETAMQNFNAMRKTEGEKLVTDMLGRMDVIERLALSVEERAPLVADEYKEKLRARITEALADVKIDEARLLNEVAFYTDKVNIDEELTRLKSHVSQFRSIVNTELSGKKLDFLMQEFNRETNTICSKSNDLSITQLGLSLKNEIEKVREQVQNIE